MVQNRIAGGSMEEVIDVQAGQQSCLYCAVHLFKIAFHI
jgi:hypothetical protein